jgi:hypothetical protein
VEAPVDFLEEVIIARKELDILNQLMENDGYRVQEMANRESEKR